MINEKIMAVIVFIACLCVTPHPVAGEDKERPETGNTVPLWEIKLMGAVFHLPHYRGSEEYETHAVPVPYIEYRGKYLRTDRSGVHGIFIQTEHFETTLSAYGNPPVKEGNDAREGMAERDPLVELGPALKWSPLGRRPNRHFYLYAALRGVASINVPYSLKTAYQGIHGVLSVVSIERALFGSRDWEAKTTLGIDITDEKYNDYFYEVSQKDAASFRPVYHPEGGYAGLFISGRLLRELTADLAISGYTRWENITGAAYEESPLVDTKNNYSFGITLIWTPWKSDKQVPVRFADF